MDTALPQKFPFILDRNLAKANCTGNRVCTSCDTVVLGMKLEKPARPTFLMCYKLQIFFPAASEILEVFGPPFVFEPSEARRTLRSLHLS